MADKKSPDFKKRALPVFDEILAAATPGGSHTIPWAAAGGDRVVYKPDYEVLTRLLGVPLYFGANTQSRVPAFALDLWLAYELRRAGFDSDSVWPRASHPRILPKTVVDLLRDLPRRQREPIEARIATRASISNVTSSDANILGKNYFKQVDVIMTSWDTGPEILVSTKRMDSSFGKNAANRVEESYGDAKNLRARHPLAAHGYLYGLRSTVVDEEPDTAEKLIDLLGKLGQEDDAYDATCLLMIEYDDVPAAANADEASVDEVLSDLPEVRIRRDLAPEALSPELFLSAIVNQVLDTTPVSIHREARFRRKSPIHADTVIGDLGTARDLSAPGDYRVDYAPLMGTETVRNLSAEGPTADNSLPIDQTSQTRPTSRD
ncbi:hypothetical protein [Brachybacterium sp. HMSC06H03]|uniref:hypothetical protein n=1 Tax=Brachybacterium sp. HMSC06H03 TaxID=1581127 RepID=UPI000B2597E4|nr:hypothetical protein [Brachybacterium sp. HMSC06H03]